MSIEYILFDEATRDRFVAFVAAKGVANEVRQDPMEGFVVGLPEDLADCLLDSINFEYESLLDEEMAASESKEGSATHRVAGVSVTCADGRSLVVRLPGAIAHRLSVHFTPEEIHALVSAIAESIDNPIDGPLCRRA